MRFQLRARPVIMRSKLSSNQPGFPHLVVANFGIFSMIKIREVLNKNKSQNKYLI